MSPPPNHHRSTAARTTHQPEASRLSTARRRSRLAGWYPIWRLLSGLFTVTLGVILVIDSYYWALLLVAAGLATLLLTRWGRSWRELSGAQKAAALPGLLIGTAVELFIVAECIPLILFGLFGSNGESRSQ